MYAIYCNILYIRVQSSYAFPYLCVIYCNMLSLCSMRACMQENLIVLALGASDGEDTALHMFMYISISYIYLFNFFSFQYACTFARMCLICAYNDEEDVLHIYM